MVMSCPRKSPPPNFKENDLKTATTTQTLDLPKWKGTLSFCTTEEDRRMDRPKCYENSKNNLKKQKEFSCRKIFLNVN